MRTIGVVNDVVAVVAVVAENIVVIVAVIGVLLPDLSATMQCLVRLLAV